MFLRMKNQKVLSKIKRKKWSYMVWFWYNFSNLWFNSGLVLRQIVVWNFGILLKIIFKCSVKFTHSQVNCSILTLISQKNYVKPKMIWNHDQDILHQFWFDVIFTWNHEKICAILLWISLFHGIFVNNVESKVPKFQTAIWCKIKPELNHEFEIKPIQPAIVSNGLFFASLNLFYTIFFVDTFTQLIFFL